MNVEIVPVQIHWGNLETLSSVLDMANCLMTQWPAPTTAEAYLTALMVCEAVLRGSEDDTAEDARAAFIDAAHEAGLSVSGDDGPDWF
ncbi:DUF982 domain-containing protein [Rhizobium ruizarguesonis]|uniref:DUF982 domain-containing protein n=1 Tax=Rhizobium ruizarguesonis TaxID=2081791 RepID=UPI00102FFC32|nr:DUF982 domain-containing protein [Rhizobium ruizarguesonis]TAU12657.1 DUF982 domain-containing protein [Rhizobium ruizarguesonis]